MMNHWMAQDRESYIALSDCMVSGGDRVVAVLLSGEIGSREEPRQDWGRAVTS